MNEVFQSAVKNLKTHPAGYTVIALVLVLGVTIIPNLNEEDRLYAFICSVVVVVVGVVFLHIRDTGHSKAVETADKGNKELGVDEKEDVVFFRAPINDRYNYPFYEYFIEKIKGAKQNIYITGDGFECNTDEGIRIAERFVAAFREALSNNVSVVRVETKCRGQLKWANMLSALKKEFSDSFQLFLVTEQKATQMASVCVIDPEVSGLSTVEIMLSTQRLFGIKAADLAGTAVFIQGHEQLAQDLRRRILTLRDSEHTIHPITDAEVLNILTGDEYYFAFGSNMDASQMTERCPSAKKVGIGVINNHELVFNRKGSYRPGGVASIQHSIGKKVYGVIWKINPTEFADLDRTEDPNAYRRFEEKIHTMDGKEYLCNVYKTIPQGNFEPDNQYLLLILDAAEAQQLPKEYIEYIKTFMKPANKAN